MDAKMPSPAEATDKGQRERKKPQEEILVPRAKMSHLFAHTTGSNFLIESSNTGARSRSPLTFKTPSNKRELRTHAHLLEKNGLLQGFGKIEENGPVVDHLMVRVPLHEGDGRKRGMDGSDGSKVLEESFLLSLRRN